MVGRVKFQVLGKHGWCTAYCKEDLLRLNILTFMRFDIPVRVAGIVYGFKAAA